MEYSHLSLRLETSLRKLDIFFLIQGNISCKDGLNKGQKWYGLNRSRRYKEEVGRIHRRTLQKRSSWPRYPWYVITHLEPDPDMWSQVGLRKHHYKQSQWRWWNSSWAISNPERWSCESAALNIPANLENSAVATGLEKVSFHSNPKERQCQRMLKLLHNWTHLTC